MYPWKKMRYMDMSIDKTDPASLFPPVAVDSSLSLEPDDTPKPRRRNKWPVLPSRASSSSPRKRPATSPKKSRAVLDQLQKPIRIHAVPDYSDAIKSLPDDVIPLYNAIAAADDKDGIVPHEVRQEVAEIIRDSPRYFDKADNPAGAARAKEVFHSLCAIKRRAADSQTYQRCESAWNNLVHTPFLQLVFESDIPDSNTTKTKSPHPQPLVHVRAEPVMSATISGDSIPLIKTADGDPFEPACSVSVESLLVSDNASNYAESNLSLSLMRSRGVKVDYVLAIDFPEDAPVRKVISRAINTGPLPHVNQTAYLPLKESPIAVAIETKTETSAQDPLVQLGIWTAAWYQHMYDLREHIAGPGPKPRLVSVPLVQVVGHNWYVYFACDRGASLDIYGPVTLGSTDGILSMYALLSSLGALKEWAQKTFCTSIEEWFL